MSVMRFRGLLVIALWQAAPSPVAFDSAGRIQGVLGFGTGQYERVRLSCEGEELGTAPVGFGGGGAQLDVWPSRDVRLTGFGGTIDADSAEWNGAYYGALAALELQRVGVGVGAVQTPEDTWPSLYVRAGNRDRLHVQVDFAAPSAPLNISGAARVGVGYHLGHLRGLGGLGGLAVCHARCDGNSNPALFADLRVPVVSILDLELRALAGGGRDHPNTGIAVAGRLHFGR